MSARASWRLRTLMVTAATMAWAAVSSAETLTLAEAVRRGAQGAAAPQIAQSRVEQRNAQVSGARSSLLPSLTGTASQIDRSYNLNTFGIPFPGADLDPLVGPFPTFDARMRATQTIADVSEWRRVKSARTNVATSEAEARTSAEDAAHDAALRYVTVERAAATVAARQSDLGIAVELDSLARVQLEAGSAANIDVLRSGTAVAAARSELSLAENALERARIDLARALGADPGARFEIADSLGQAVVSDAPEDQSAAVNLATERRSELEAERSRLEHARAERGAISAERIPRLDAAVDYGASGQHIDDAIGTGQVGFQLTWPLFDGAGREARIREQNAVIHASEIQSRDLLQQVSAEVQRALLDLAAGREQESIAAERVSLALQQLAEARVRFRNGVAGNIEVIDAQTAVVRARDNEIFARAATAAARIHLARAAGVAETVR